MTASLGTPSKLNPCRPGRGQGAWTHEMTLLRPDSRPTTAPAMSQSSGDPPHLPHPQPLNKMSQNHIMHEHRGAGGVTPCSLAGKAMHTGSHEEQGHLEASIPVCLPSLLQGPKVLFLSNSPPNPVSKSKKRWSSWFRNQNTQ